MNQEILRVGVLGAGRWAERAHLPGYQRTPYAKVVAICDPVRELAERLAKEFNIPDVYTDHRHILDRKDVDVVDVCTPSDTHEILTFQVIEAGKHTQHYLSQ